MRALRRLWPYLRRYPGPYLLGFVTMLASNLFGTLGPRYVQRGIDALGPAGDADTVRRAALMVLGLAVAGGVLRFGMRQWLNGASRRVETDLRDDLFTRLLRLPAAWHLRHPVGDLMARATNDLLALRMVAGPAVILSFVLAAVACAFSALSYAELASSIPVSGSAYTYTYATLGEIVAWIIGWDLILEYGVSVAAIAVGWGGVYGLAMRATERQGPGTVYTFVLGGKAPAPEFVQYRMDKLVQGVKYDPAKVEAGTLLYVSNCVFYHGVPGVDRGGNIPNLGYMNAAYIENLDKFVFKGPAMERGMPDFSSSRYVARTSSAGVTTPSFAAARCATATPMLWMRPPDRRKRSTNGARSTSGERRRGIACSHSSQRR